MFLVTLSFVILSLAAVSADCQITPTLLSQDPYPAVPGDYVKLVFQVSGMQNPDCNNVLFELAPEYPISFDPGASSKVTINSGTYSSSDYTSNVLIPYRVRVDTDALDGANPIEFRYSTSGDVSSYTYVQFNLEVNDTQTDFDVFVKDFNPITNEITLEILNIGKRDVEALTVKLPSQDDFIVKGSNVDIVGSLDSNDYSTANFEISPSSGDLKMEISYSDSIGVRRSVNKTVYFDPSVFDGRKGESNGGSFSGYIFLGVVIIGLVAYIFYRRHKKNKKKKLLREK